jgi:predicted MFS family arabinose efflux permease
MKLSYEMSHLPRYNAVVAVQVIWSARVFSDRPSAGLAAVMFMSALGLLAGPPLFGALADAVGFAAVFCAAAALLLGAIGLMPHERLDTNPA